MRVRGSNGDDSVRPSRPGGINKEGLVRMSSGGSLSGVDSETPGNTLLQHLAMMIFLYGMVSPVRVVPCAREVAGNRCCAGGDVVVRSDCSARSIGGTG